jgi:hypothetical protein
MESAQTGQVGKSQPRGSGLDATVEMTSANAAIVTSLRSDLSFTAALIYTPICLTLSQHKCVALSLFVVFSVLQCSEFLTERFLACTLPRAASN